MAGQGDDRRLNLRVGVIGGSIAGCTTAVELLRLGCDVTLLERSGEALKDRGVGIGLPTPVMDMFIGRDLVDADLPYFLCGTTRRVWRTDAEPQLGHRSWDQPTNLAVLNWGALYRNLRKRVPDNIYRTRHDVTAIENLDDGARVTLANGEQMDFDLLVCADGYNSLGRRTLFPDVSMHYAGYILWRGALPEDQIEDSAYLENAIHIGGYEGGHAPFYLVPRPDDASEAGQRLINWGAYLAISPEDLPTFLVDRQGRAHEGSLSPGGMPVATEDNLKDRTRAALPTYYSEIIDKSSDTFAYAVFECEIPSYRRGRICLVGDAGSFARPHTAAGALKGINDVIALGKHLQAEDDVETALSLWDDERTAHNNHLVRFGQQLGACLVTDIPDWSQMDEAAMQQWFDASVTVQNDFLVPLRKMANG